MGNKPKPLNQIIDKMVRAKESESTNKGQHHVDTVDVEAFLERERNFKAQLAQQQRK